MDTTDSGDLKPEKLLRWTVTVLADGEDLILPLPEDMLEQVGWKTGDVLQWVCKDDQTWILQRKEPSASEDV